MQECSNTAMLTVTQDGIFDVTVLVIVVKKKLQTLNMPLYNSVFLSWGILQYDEASFPSLV